MKKLLIAIMAICLGASLMAQNTAVTKTAKKKSAKTVKVAKPSTETQLTEIRTLLTSQQALIQKQQAQIVELQKQLTQNQAAAESAVAVQKQSFAAKSEELTAATVAAQKTAEAANAEVVAVKKDEVATAGKLEAAEKRVKDLESPTTLHFKGITLTPGGFIDADAVWRSRNENSDMSSSFAGIPYGGTANANLSEFRASSRVSRLSLLAEGKLKNMKLTGYFEVDFMAQPPTANQVETNAFSPRIRQGFVQAALDNGWTFTAGQMWGLITTNRKGVDVRAEYIPNTIEASYVIGYNYVRQTSFRIAKKSKDGKHSVAFEVANPETTYKAAYVPGGSSATGNPTYIFGLNSSSNATSPTGSTVGYLAGSTNGFSTNLMPDFIGKYSYDSKWGHYEVKAILRAFRDRVDPTGAAANTGLPSTARTNVSMGGGLGFGAVMPLVAKKLDWIVEGLGGAGIGRYAASVSPDVTLRTDGVLVPLHAYHLLTGLEWHPTPKWDVNFYGGDEYVKRAGYVTPAGGPAGYGSPLVSAATAAAATREVGYSDGLYNKNLWEVSFGAWYKIYKGPIGTFQYGMQYEYLSRSTWSTLGGAPKGRMDVILTSFRYILP